MNLVSLPEVDKTAGFREMGLDSYSKFNHADYIEFFRTTGGSHGGE
jgi:hypothetical protein